MVSISNPEMLPASPVGLPHAVLRTFEDAEPFREAWDLCVRQNGGDVYQSFDWCRTWWRHYGKGRDLHLVLHFHGDQLVGLFPGFVETIWLGPTFLKVVKMIGADFSLQLCNIPAQAEALAELLSFVTQYFLQQRQCDVLLIGPAAGRTARIEEILALARAETGAVAEVMVLGHTCNTFFDLPESSASYLAALSSKQRSNLKRQWGKLRAEHDLVMDVVSSEEEVEAEFEKFVELHQTQWTAEGKLGHFDDWPSARAFNRDLVCSLGRQGCVRFYRIIADGETISSQYVFVFGDRAYWRLPARNSDEKWAKYGLGVLGLDQILEASINERVVYVDAGRGHYAYKVQMGGKESPLRTLVLARRGASVAIRFFAFRAAASLLDLVYYKSIFRRLAPRISFLQRPLWPRWIRTQW